MKKLYFLLLSTFIFRVAFAAFPYDTELVNWYMFSDQTATAQFAFWRLMTLLVDGAFIISMLRITLETTTEARAHCYKMATILFWIQTWYIFEYCTHYTSVWITWEDMQLHGNGKSGLSSHIVTMSIFAYFGWYV